MPFALSKFTASATLPTKVGLAGSAMFKTTKESATLAVT